MKLKTLKDFAANSEDLKIRETYAIERETMIKELKQEAIKWIKELENQICEPNGYCEHYIDISGTLDWIKNFFNITEEDLK